MGINKIQRVGFPKSHHAPQILLIKNDGFPCLTSTFGSSVEGQVGPVADLTQGHPNGATTAGHLWQTIGVDSIQVEASMGATYQGKGNHPIGIDAKRG